jgi:RNA polymerase sigma-70 factor, ECF subfamily
MLMEYTEFEDAALVAAIAGGDESALGEVYRRYGPAVNGLARRILSDASLADDVTQDVFVLLWRNCDRFDPNRGRLRTMLLTQTHGKSVDLIRSRNARVLRETKVHETTPVADAAIDAELMSIIEVQQVREAVEQLPSDERIPLELAYFGGNTYRSVATLLGLPEGTVKTRIRTGLRRLHALLNEHEIDTTTETSSPNPAQTTQTQSNTQSSTQSNTQSQGKDSPWTAS